MTQISSSDLRQVEEDKSTQQDYKDTRQRHWSRKRKIVDLVQAIKPSPTVQSRQLTVSINILSRTTRSKSEEMK